jgi:hypothetical protein
MRIQDDKLEVVIFRTQGEDDLVPSLYSLNDLYLRAGYLVHEHFGSNAKDVLEHYLKQLKELSERLPK